MRPSLARVLLCIVLAAMLFGPSPLADAQPSGGAPNVADRQVSLRAMAGFAQVEDALRLQSPGNAELIIPPLADSVQAFALDGEQATALPWTWTAADRILIRATQGGGSPVLTLQVSYRIALGPSGAALDLTPTSPTAALRFAAQLPDGWEARLANGPAFVHAGPAWTQSWANIKAGAALAVAVAPNVGPSPLVVLGAMMVLILLGSLARSLTARGKEPNAAMGLLDHLHELQARLRVVLLAVALLMLVLFTVELVPISVGGLQLAMPVPSLTDNIAAQTFRLISQQFVPPGVQLVVVDPLSGAMVQVEVALFLALLVGSPLIAYEAGAFLMPALTPRERRSLLRAIPAATGLFVAGALFAYLLMVPTMMRVLYSYAQGLGARPFLAVDSLVSFAIIVTLIFGIAFELPVFMVALAKLGLVKPQTMATKWRHIVVGIFIAAAVITPDPTVVSQLMVAIPMLVLYGIGLVAARAAVKPPSMRQATPPSPR